MRVPAESPIALIGLMGAGKSVVAEHLASTLGVPLADLDARIEGEAGRPIAALFAEEGEAAFRVRERESLRHALAEGAGVIACGGGIVVGAQTREDLRHRCRVVWLEVEPDEAARRVANTASSRPLLAGGEVPDRLRALLSERRELYARTAHARIATDGRSIAEIADLVIAALRSA